MRMQEGPQGAAQRQAALAGDGQGLALRGQPGQPAIAGRIGTHAPRQLVEQGDQHRARRAVGGAGDLVPARAPSQSRPATSSSKAAREPKIR